MRNRESIAIISKIHIHDKERSPAYSEYTETAKAATFIKPAIVLTIFPSHLIHGNHL